jgi:uncharacterized protein
MDENQFIIQLTHWSEENLLRKFLYFSLTIIFLVTSCQSGMSSGASANKVIQIHDIQGCVHRSPMEGKNVNQIEGIVTWKTGSGFFFQDETPDNLDCSSEGLFVFTGNYPDTIPGDRVAVSGTIKEVLPDSDQSNLTTTEIEAKTTQILSVGNPLPDPVVLGGGGRKLPDKVIDDDKFANFDIQSDGLDFYESLEGMRVEIKEALVVGPENSYKEIIVIPTEMESSNVISETGALIETEYDQNPERILISLPDAYQKQVDQGALVTAPIIGILDYEYGNYRLIETNLPTIESSSYKNYPKLSKLDAKIFRIATYNVNNFDRFDDAKLLTLSNQINKYLADPDILVLQEIMDDSGLTDDGVTSADRTLSGLVDQIYQDSGVAYKYIDPQVKNNSSGGASGGNIRTVILYRVDRGLQLIDPMPSWLKYDSSAFSTSRLPTIAEFKFGKRAFFVVGVHLVSNSGNSPDFGSAQPPKEPDEAKRIRQVQVLVDIVKKLRSHEDNASILLAGDFNDVPWSNTLTDMDNSGLVNTAYNILENERYSILFEGNASLFDQILISKDLTESVVGTYILHLNTGFPEKKQVSDHDPFIIDLKQ